MPPKKSKAKVKRRQKRKQKGPKNQVQERPLLKSMIPPVYFRLNTLGTDEGKSSHIYVVEGRETMAEIRTSQYYNASRVSPYINPANVLFAPRLASIASAFERYKFDWLRVEFHTAAPATRSGSIGLLIKFDPQDEEPVSMVQIAENEAGAVGTVAEDLAVEGSWPEADPYYLMTPDISSSDTFDAQWRYPGRLWVATGDSVSADNRLLAGYLSVEYRVRLLRCKPATNLLAAGESAAGQTATDTASYLDWSMDNLVGWWDWFNSPSSVPQGTLEFREQVAAAAGDWSTNYLLEWAGAAFDEAERKVFSPRTSAMRDRVVEKRCTKWLNPAFSRDPQKRLAAANDPKLCEPPSTPMTAGDITVNLRGQTLMDGTFSTIAQLVSAGATTARDVEDVIQFTLSEASRLALQVQLATGETRALSDAHWAVNPLEVLE
jgi:hypothetical protein